ncbi:uncharacterized protein osm [Labeo rohita]|uniref:uncharacterized protein osm n=1 Tax=Labeo rohita TaxID=84645 RepID=UPI0021E2A64F|nr:uncharacterized protein osm [Labeo rohita]
MEAKTGLLIWWILMMIQGMTCRPTCRPTDRPSVTPGCHVIARTDFTKTIMKQLLEEFLSINGNTSTTWPSISELELTNLPCEEKIQKAQCGLNFMRMALELIYQHQSELHNITKPIFNQTNAAIKELKLTNDCVSKAVGKCTKNITQPVFAHADYYSKKHWDQAVLETSVDFLDELLKMVRHLSSKKTLTSKK